MMRCCSGGQYFDPGATEDREPKDILPDQQTANNKQQTVNVTPKHHRKLLHDCARSLASCGIVDCFDKDHDGRSTQKESSSARESF
jgi:hypothetical protein